METKNIFTERRSVNNFDITKKIEDSLIKEIINLGVYAPSAFNLQPWRVIVVKTDENKKKLFKLSNQQPKVLEASATVIIIGNKNGYFDTNPVWNEMLQSVGGNQEIVNGAKQAASYLYGTSNDRKIKFAESNAGLLAMSIMYAAQHLGVDTHAMSGIDFEGIHSEFGLQENEEVVMQICIGYADKTKDLYPRRPRRNFDEIGIVI